MSQIADGTVKFTVRDSRLNSLLEILYPVGSIKITVSSIAPFSDLGFGTWEEVSKGRVLLGADDRYNAGSTVKAGLPNITGNAGGCEWTETSSGYNGLQFGAFYVSRGGQGENNGEVIVVNSWENSQNGVRRRNLNLNASRCSIVYGNSDTVTPPLTSFISGNGLPKEHKNIRQYHIGRVV